MNTINQLNLTLTNPVSSDAVKPADDASQAQKKQFAKDFESVFIEKLLDEMQKTIGNWGFEQDAAAKQIQGLFWLHLARDVSENGGMGMWKEIYQSLDRFENNPETVNNKR